MTAHLRETDLEEIVRLLDGWTGKLTWQALLVRVERRLHRKYARLTLSRKPRIVEAFRLCKDRLLYEKESVKELSIEAQLIARLRAENERLQNENRMLLEQHLRWRYNTHCRGLDLNSLNQPLPPVDRGKTVL